MQRFACYVLTAALNRLNQNQVLYLSAGGANERYQRCGVSRARFDQRPYGPLSRFCILHSFYTKLSFISTAELNRKFILYPFSLLGLLFTLHVMF
jgi:hypothetical protein